jgi:two-component system response regulator ChvI
LREIDGASQPKQPRLLTGRRVLVVDDKGLARQSKLCVSPREVRILQNARLAASARDIASVRDVSSAIRIVVVDDDDLFRETLDLDLTDQGYEVTSFSGGMAALDHVASGGCADLILLDWCMPGMSGLEVLRSLRRTGNTTPVIFLTMLSEDIYEEAALEDGAVDFIDKLRSRSILIRRLRLIAAGTRPAPGSDGKQSVDALQLGRLDLRFDINRASWSNTPIPLTLTEFKVVALLALRNGEDVSFREIYDLVQGKDFTSGYGAEGYRTNVHCLVKRIRKKFCHIDPEFEYIVNYAGFGYRYQCAV